MSRAAAAATARTDQNATCFSPRTGGRAATRALARALAAQGDSDGALLELRGLLDENSGDDRTRAELGRLLLAEGRSTDALKAYEEWIEVVAPAGNPDSSTRGGRSS